jgi:hypothetical protein
MREEILFRILKIGHNTSIRGAGISLESALSQSKYLENSANFDVEDLLQVIKLNPPLVNEWVMYSEDKRTSSGFYISNNQIGSIEKPNKKYRFDSKEELIANYVIKELDFWVNHGKQ